jgi:amino acid adenylation domain-containing protein
MSDRLAIDHLGPVHHPYEPFPESSVQTGILDRFDAVARRFADRLAIQDCTTSLSYAELATMSGCIAAATAAATAGRARPVAILLESEARYPAAMLGILRAGRIYLPLDADAPIERNRTILSETGAGAILSAGELLSDARAMAPQGVAVVDIASADPVRQCRFATGPHDLAYIVYTSGSTGSSKCIAFCHRNALRKALQYTNTIQISCFDRLLLVRPLHTSAADRSLYGALLNGASLHILPPLQLGPAGLVREIAARGISVYHSSPTLLRRIAEVLAPGERLRSVRVAALGGEAAEWRDVDLCRRSFAPDVRVNTGLNSTECSAGLCQWFVDDALRETCRRPPVGRPLCDRRVTIVGDDGNPVADGEVGELVVSSRHLALGYWRGADLTVDPFPTDPDDPESRVLNTGDLGIRRSDGLIEFAGRKDDVVKLHGQRIDCLEVESALTALRQVHEGAIVVQRDGSGIARQLVAYVTLHPGNHGLLGRHLQTMLARSLPTYMVPARIIVLEQLPRLPNLKIDRVRLAHMAAQPTESHGRPTDPLSDDVARVFETCLELTGASADDNIASLGGDSLQAMTVVAEIERQFGVVMPDDLAAEDPTIQRIADWLHSHGLSPRRGDAETTQSGTRPELVSLLRG